MDVMLIATAALCVLVGLTLGLLGGGGTVLMVPLFVYVAKAPVEEAIAMSLVIVGLSSAVGVIKYWRRGLVNKRLVLLFVLPGMLASFLGARAAQAFSSEQLLVMFGGLMLPIAVVIYYNSRKTGADGPVICRPAFWLSVTAGIVTGFLTGLLGVGGGFLIVPAIAVLMRCSMYTAIGTSLAIIAVNSTVGFAGHLTTMRIDMPMSAIYFLATAGGALAGTRLLNKFSVGFLQRAFAVLVFLIGLLITAQHL